MFKYKIFIILFFVLFLYCSTNNLSQNSATGWGAVSNSLDTCFNHQIGIGQSLDYDKSHVQMSLTFACRRKQNELRLYPQNFPSFHTCLFDNWTLNWKGKLYKSCGNFYDKITGTKLNMVCKNMMWNNYEILEVNLSDFVTVTNGVANAKKNSINKLKLLHLKNLEFNCVFL